MKRKIALLMILTLPTLGGCALQAALAAAELVRYIPTTEPASNAHLEPTAKQACAARAAQYGTVNIIDVEQRRADRLVVWGSTTDTAGRRRSFDCHFTNALVDFNVRDIQ